MAGIAGFEPTMPESESGALPLGDIPLMVRLKRFELLAHALEGRCSIQLS